MEKYLGVKLIEAEPITLGDYKKFKGWTILEGEDPIEEGYKVKYSDDYISWSPKEVFEEAYRPITDLTFGLAVEAIKKNFKVARRGWNGKDMHVIVAKLIAVDGIEVNNDCFLLFNVNGKYNTWIPSITDILVEDWYIVE